MIVLAVDSVTKRYRVHSHGAPTLLDWAIRRLRGEPRGREDVWALRDVSFEVEHGSALGIIGHNGAGKSTLLRLLCGITLPTGGRVTRVGLVSGLLELGGGFQFDCTGRQNLMTAGLLTGLTAAEIRARQDEIVAFAELEKVIDRPVRTYSSGMFLRLAFAAAVHFEPAILVVDEVLAVGDVRFQQKCLDRIQAFRNAGKTLVLTSHSREQIKLLCDDVLVLDEGRLVMRGAPVDAFRCYDDLMLQRTERRARTLGGAPVGAPARGTVGVRHGTQEGAIEAVQLQDAEGRVVSAIEAGAPIEIELELRLPAAHADFALGVSVHTETDEQCFDVFIDSGAATFGPLAERATVRCALPALPLRPARYFVVVGLYPPGCDHIWDYHWQMHPLLVLGDRPSLGVQPHWSVEKRELARKHHRLQEN